MFRFYNDTGAPSDASTRRRRPSYLLNVTPPPPPPPPPAASRRRDTDGYMAHTLQLQKFGVKKCRSAHNCDHGAADRHRGGDGDGDDGDDERTADVGSRPGTSGNVGRTGRRPSRVPPTAADPTATRCSAESGPEGLWTDGETDRADAVSRAAPRRDDGRSSSASRAGDADTGSERCAAGEDVAGEVYCRRRENGAAAVVRRTPSTFSLRVHVDRATPPPVAPAAAAAATAADPTTDDDDGDGDTRTEMVLKRGNDGPRDGASGGRSGPWPDDGDGVGDLVETCKKCPYQKTLFKNVRFRLFDRFGENGETRSKNVP